jgi:hypothetical protein
MANKCFRRYDLDLNGITIPDKWKDKPLTDLYVDTYYLSVWLIDDMRKFFKNVPMDSTPETITLKPQPYVC